MNTTKTIAALFDFDGVIMDTETQYTVFWDAKPGCQKVSQ